MEEAKKDVSEYKLPTPDYPSMDMPEAPKVEPTRDPNDPIMGCDGEVYKPVDVKSSPIPPPAPGEIRILIGIPILTWSHEFAESFLKFWTQLCTRQDLGFKIGYQFVYRTPVHMAEQRLVETAQYNKCTHILFMDDDIYDVNVEMLQKLLVADKDVISGIMYASKFPYAMCAFRRYNTNLKVIDMPSDNSMYRLYEIPCTCPKCGMGQSHWDAKWCPACGNVLDNLVQKVDLIPFPFTLIKMSVFDRIKKPWFHCTERYPTDSWFADRCIEAGIQEWAHMGVRLNHNGVNDITRPFRMQMGIEESKARGAGIVNITPEEMEKHQFLLSNKMKDAENLMKDRTKPEFIGPTGWTVGANQDKKEASNDQNGSSSEKDPQDQQGVSVSG